MSRSLRKSKRGHGSTPDLANKEEDASASDSRSALRKAAEGRFKAVGHTLGALNIDTRPEPYVAPLSNEAQPHCSRLASFAPFSISTLLSDLILELNLLPIVDIHLSASTI